MSETIADSQTRLSAFILENNPQADIAPGTVLSELVVKLVATLQNQVYNEVQVLSLALSVQQALASTTDTYSPAIDEVASNFETSRFQGQLSTGVLKVIVSSGARGYTLPQGMSFTQTALNLQYVTSQVYNVVLSSTPTSGQLSLLFDGTNYYFLLPVVAASVGSQYQVSNGATFALTSTSNLSNFVSATAYGAFTTGLPQDTDKQLIAKMQANITNQSLTSSKAIAAVLSSEYPAFQTLSAVGAHDPEMVRSKRNFCGISTFGKADIYVRTAVAIEQLVITKVATKTAQGIWQLSMAAVDAPGFYQIVSILPTPVNNVTTAGTLVINSVTYGYDQDQFNSNNEVTNVSDARFSAYQTAVVIFQYTEPGNLAVGSTLSMDITVSYLPNIRDIQQMFQDGQTRALCGDYLIRAALPCFVSLNISLIQQNLTDTPTSVGIPALKQDIFNYINTIPFGQTLNASKIIELCHQYPIQRVDLPIQMTGLIYTLSGSTISISGNDTLEIPSSLADGVTPNTTLYFIDYTGEDLTGAASDNIGISLT